jgi:hypothetical protein
MQSLLEVLRADAGFSANATKEMEKHPELLRAVVVGAAQGLGDAIVSQIGRFDPIKVQPYVALAVLDALRSIGGDTAMDRLHG